MPLKSPAVLGEPLPLYCILNLGAAIQPFCIAIGKTTLLGIFVIPGLTRNPAHFRSVALLDAGSGPA